MNLYTRIDHNWEKSVPAFVKRGTKLIKSLYLRALFEGGAYPIHADYSNEDPEEQYCYEKLIETKFGGGKYPDWPDETVEYCKDVSEILAEFGITMKCQNHDIDSCYTSYLGIIKGDDIERFMDHIGLEDSSDYVKRKTLFDLEITDWTERVRRLDEWKQYIPLKVVKRETVGMHMTYDVTTETSNYVANGVIVHS
jgi:intein/homing endonuclease